MHDLATIQDNAAKALGSDNAIQLLGVIENFQRQGRHVLVKYAGLSVTSVESFTDPTEADAALNFARTTAQGSEHCTLLFPTKD